MLHISWNKKKPAHVDIISVIPEKSCQYCTKPSHFESTTDLGHWLLDRSLQRQATKSDTYYHGQGNVFSRIACQMDSAELVKVPEPFRSSLPQETLYSIGKLHVALRRAVYTSSSAHYTFMVIYHIQSHPILLYHYDIPLQHLLVSWHSRGNSINITHLLGCFYQTW